MNETTYEIITTHQKLICALNIWSSIENPVIDVIKARMSVEDAVQDSWDKVRQIDGADFTFKTAQQNEILN